MKQLRLLLVVLLGCAAPVAYWSSPLTGLQPFVSYILWWRNAGLPEVVMAPLIPWGSVFVALLIGPPSPFGVFRVILAPAMLLVRLAIGIFVWSEMMRSLPGEWGAETADVNTVLWGLAASYPSIPPFAGATVLGCWLFARARPRSSKSGDSILFSD